MTVGLRDHVKTPSALPLAALRCRLLQRKCACGGGAGLFGACAECSRTDLDLQRSPLSAEAMLTTPGWEREETSSLVHDVLRSPGQPLDAAARAFMEARLGHDFNQVRVHTDTRAAESARAVNALAYTVGRAVVFGNGQYAPGTTAGRTLLAHELAHVVQQSGSTAVTPMASNLSSTSQSGYESEADAVAVAVAANAPVRVRERAAPQVQRAAPAAAPAAGVLLLLKRCVTGALLSMALDAAIQYGIHLWRLRRWPWERARETWDAYRHNWCATVLSAVLGCFGAVAAHRWIQPLLRRSTPLGGAAGGTVLGRLLLWLATQGILAPRMAVKWLGKFRCIEAFEAESLYPGITSEEEALAEAPAAASARPGDERARA